MHIEKSIKTFFLRVDWVSNRINMWYQVPRRKNFDFIFICSEATAQTSWRGSSLFQCDDFWLPGAESFSMVYIMNDFAAIIFRRYYTLKQQTWGSRRIEDKGSYHWRKDFDKIIVWSKIEEA